MSTAADAFDAVILANGQFPSHPVPLAVLHGAARLVACDGAAVAEADVIIGDGDSVPDRFRPRLLKIDEQEDNDLTKATRYCVAQGYRRIAYVGATGKREDHTLGNLSLLVRYYRDMGVSGVMYTDHGFFTPARGDRAFPSFPGQQVSIFNFGSQHIASDGLKWDAYTYREWWQGTLNEALSSRFTLHADGYYLVYQTYEP